MRNIELKARLRDPAGARETCATLGARPCGDIRQTDTYFDVREGRLKLREAEPGRTELVQYFRDDVAGARGCDYQLCVVEAGIKNLLAESLGVLTVVDKVRSLYLWENVRIHLDTVETLGNFLEFEAVLDETHDDEDGHQKLAMLTQTFGLAPDDLCPQSYLDLRLAR